MIVAKRKDGTPVKKGDRVLAVWDNGVRLFGSVSALGDPMRFGTMKGKHLQTYTIRCQDGTSRPAHALHIKTTIDPKTWRKKK